MAAHQDFGGAAYAYFQALLAVGGNEVHLDSVEVAILGLHGPACREAQSKDHNPVTEIFLGS